MSAKDAFSRGLYTTAVIAVVADVTGISPALIAGPKRVRRQINARFIAASLLRTAGHSYTFIATRLRREHTGVMNMIRRVSENPADFEPHLTQARVALHTLVAESHRPGEKRAVW